MNNELLDYVKELTKNDNKNLSKKVSKLFEEGGELAKKTLPYEDADGTRHRFTNRGGILEEVADVILVALSIGYDIGMTDEELQDFMLKKAKYWQGLQRNEADTPKSLPYEIHVTVDPKHSPSDGTIQEWNYKQDWNFFAHACDELNIKPLALNNYSSDTDTITMVMMGNKTMRGTAREADELMENIATWLSDYHFKPIRKKIETVPWHPAGKDSISAKHYWECHLKVKVKVIDFKEFLKELKRNWPAENFLSFGLSWNASKEPVDGVRTYFATIRGKISNRKDFEFYADSFRLCMEHSNYVLEVTSENIELAVFDSAEDQDKSWIITG